ncbi:MAG: DUF2031 domain-containing protein [Spirochaetia bacterium]|jgi:hypothetical protein|nr:DUF2031 domain-containing protein [Spirochaetia bacterium]
MSNQKNITLNRIVAFLVGGLLVFAVMSFTVVSKAKTQNAELKQSLDISRFEASRLLADAKAQFTVGDFKEAKLSLTTLFNNQPGSTEAEEGRILVTEIDMAEKTINEKWETALPGVQAEWNNARALELRAEWDSDRVKLENEIESKIDQAWEKEKDEIRSEWMKKN